MGSPLPARFDSIFADVYSIAVGDAAMENRLQRYQVHRHRLFRLRRLDAGVLSGVGING